MQTLLTNNGTWTLTEFGEDSSRQRTVSLTRSQTLVGRTDTADFSIPVAAVSKQHAMLTLEDDRLLVEDLNSTNGTFVNGCRVKTSLLVAGDLLQFANEVYRVGRQKAFDAEGTREAGILPWTQALLLFDRLIGDCDVLPHFQPIVTMNGGERVGFELLARSRLEGLTNPMLMFSVAERLGQQATLSELMRDQGLKRAMNSSDRAADYFLNTHPCEVVNDRLCDSLRKLRRDYPEARVVLEIHEGAVVDPETIQRLRRLLDELDMRLSFDDFGSGHGRLLELGECPPDVLKFDMQLIRGIDAAPAGRQEMLAALVKLSKDLGTTPLAEGVETAAEDTACRQIGFELGQGYFYGRPAPF